MSFTEGPLQERSDVFVQEPAATVIDAPVVETGAPVPVAPVAVAPVSAGHVRTAYNSRFAPDAVIAGVVGLVLLVVGLIAIVRGGFDGHRTSARRRRQFRQRDNPDARRDEHAAGSRR